MRYFKRLSQAGFDHVGVFVVFIVVFALVGSFMLIEGRAAAWGGQLELGSDKQLCLDNYAGTTASGNTIDAYSCNGTVSQYWRINDLSGYTDRFELKVGQGTCANNTSTVYNGTTYHVGTNAANRVYVRSTVCTTASNYDLWEWDGSALKNIGSGGCINDPVASKNAGTALVVYSCNGTPTNELWYEAAQTGSGGSATSTDDCYGSVVGGNTCYYWVGAYQQNNNHFSASGVSADMYQPNPKVVEASGATGLSHSIFEIYAASASGGQAVEIGWYKDPGDSSPEFFCTDWVNNNFIGYAENGSTGYVQVSSTFKPGSKVTVGAVGNYKIQFANNEWQFWYNGAEIGYFPESVWTSRNASFTSIGWVSPYGEVANGYLGTATTVAMGNGILGSSSGSAYIDNYTLYNSSTPAELTDFYEPQESIISYYDYGSTGPTGMRIGGPGF